MLIQAVVLWSVAFAENHNLSLIPEQDWMPRTVCVLPIIDALRSAEFHLGYSWKTHSVLQEKFIQFLREHPEPLHAAFNRSEHNYLISDDADEANHFIAKKGFAIELPQHPESSLYFVSNVYISLLWPRKFQPLLDTAQNGVQYRFAKNTDDFVVWHTPASHKYPIFRMRSASGDEVYVTKADRPRSNFDLYFYIENILSPVTDGRQKMLHSGVLKFPCVNIDEICQSIKWLMGFSCNNYSIVEALQRVQFSLSEVGIQTESSIVQEKPALHSLNRQDEWAYIVDEPFFIWIQRKGVPYILFAAYCDYDCWRTDDPGEKECDEMLQPLRSIAAQASCDISQLPPGLFDMGLLFGDHE